jgi:electron transfer flavoprotein alpha subunit
MLYGGLAVQTVVSAARPQMATIAPRSYAPAEVQEGHTGSIRALPPAPPSPVKLVARTPKASESVDITEAKTIVCVGRGVAKQEDVAMARELASLVEGEVACSRPVAEELHWLPEEVYLGISGNTVRPGLYIGLGVSGQIQHVTGIRDSKVIVAINKDENAPIFDAADYGIVGDLYQALPVLVQELKSALKK